MFKHYKELKNEIKSGSYSTDKKQELKEMNLLYLKIIGIVILFNALVSLLMLFLVDSLAMAIVYIIVIICLNIFEIKVICDLSERLVDIYKR
mgnify:FL=1